MYYPSALSLSRIPFQIPDDEHRNFTDSWKKKEARQENKMRQIQS